MLFVFFNLFCVNISYLAYIILFYQKHTTKRIIEQEPRLPLWNCVFDNVSVHTHVNNSASSNCKSLPKHIYQGILSTNLGSFDIFEVVPIKTYGYDFLKLTNISCEIGKEKSTKAYLKSKESIGWLIPNACESGIDNGGIVNPLSVSNNGIQFESSINIPKAIEIFQVVSN